MHRWVRYGVTRPVYHAGLSFRQPQDLLHTWHGRPHPGDDFDPRGGIEKGHHSHLLWHDNLWICTLRKLPQGSTCMQKCVKTTQSHTDNIFVCRRNICGYSICVQKKSHKTSAEVHLPTLGTFCFVWYGIHKLKRRHARIIDFLLFSSSPPFLILPLPFVLSTFPAVWEWDHSEAGPWGGRWRRRRAIHATTGVYVGLSIRICHLKADISDKQVQNNYCHQREWKCLDGMTFTGVPTFFNVFSALKTTHCSLTQQCIDFVINQWTFVCQPAGMCCRKTHTEATGAALCGLGEGTPHSSPWLPHGDEWWQPEQPHELHRQPSGMPQFC